MVNHKSRTTSIPFANPSSFPTKYADATSSSFSNTTGLFTPDLGEKKAGNSSDCHVPTGTANVSNTSMVRLISNIDLTPAEMTMIGVRDSSMRSVEMSSECSPPLCTPPVPPDVMERDLFNG